MALLKTSKTRDCPVGPRALSESSVELGNDEMKSYSRGTVLKLCHGVQCIGGDRKMGCSKNRGMQPGVKTR